MIRIVKGLAVLGVTVFIALAAWLMWVVIYR